MNVIYMGCHSLAWCCWSALRLLEAKTSDPTLHPHDHISSAYWLHPKHRIHSIVYLCEGLDLRVWVLGCCTLVIFVSWITRDLCDLLVDVDPPNFVWTDDICLGVWGITRPLIVVEKLHSGRCLGDRESRWQVMSSLGWRYIFWLAQHYDRGKA